MSLGMLVSHRGGPGFETQLHSSANVYLGKLKYLVSATHVDDLDRIPGSLLRPGPTLDIAAFGHESADGSCVCVCVCVTVSLSAFKYIK